jgi:hypothetical protein
MKMPVSISLAIVGFIIAAASGTAAYFINKDNTKLATWPTVQGVIKVSDKELTRRRIASNNQQEAVLWHPVVKYAYNISGVAYTGNQISYGDYDEVISHTINGDYNNVPPSPKFQALLSKYAVGNTVTVHYNPLNPKEAVLETNDATGLRLFGIIAIGGLLMSVISLAIYFINKK